MGNANLQTKTEVKSPDWWRDKKVLVTGASGFKGSWLAKVLLELGAEVYGTASRRVSPLSSYHLLDLEEGIIKVDVDISDQQHVFDMLNIISPDVIFHLAAKAQVPVALRDPSRAFEVNIMGTINVLEGCRQLGVTRRLLVVSTDHVFGDIHEENFHEGGKFEDGVFETSRVDYGGPYDTSKSAMELCVRCYHHTYWPELPAIGITRAANAFGCGDVGARRVIPNFVRKAINPPHEIPLTCRKNARQFIYVADVVAGYIRAAASLNEDDPKFRNQNQPLERSRKEFTPTFHFAVEEYEKTSEPFVRIELLANLIADAFGAEVVEQKDCSDYAPNENPVLALNCQSTRQRLGWNPCVELAEGIEKLGKWYSQQDKPYLLRNMLKEDIQSILDSLAS